MKGQRQRKDGRKTQQQQQPSTGPRWQEIVALVVFVLYWYLFITKAQQIIDQSQEGNTLMDQLQQQQPREQPPSSLEQLHHRYIVFHPIPDGQGLGNILHGLLSVHLLGQEFDRVVCVDSQWEGFHRAFRSKRSEGCLQVQEQLPKRNDEKQEKSVPSLKILTYGRAPNECRLRSVLRSAEPVVGITANTYPRWPPVSPGLWDLHYEPTKKLQSVLPYQEQPETVVHLRSPDNIKFDPRGGLDPASLQALANKLPSNTFLVTNNVDYYQYFKDKVGWDHPGWKKVRHSALRFITWGTNAVEHWKFGKNDTDQLDEGRSLELFSDWYTILKAQKVYHTFSDFSQSAVHWSNNIDSKIIGGVSNITGELKLSEEVWRKDEHETKPLSQRSKGELQNCNAAQLALQDDDDTESRQFSQDLKDFAAIGVAKKKKTT